MKRLVQFILLFSMLIFTYNLMGQDAETTTTKKMFHGEEVSITSLEGTIEMLEVKPSKNKEGKFATGTHMIIYTTDKQLLNIHLGPTDKVADLIADADIGEDIRIVAFQKNELPKDHYVAVELFLDGRKRILRDESLHPFWSGKKDKKCCDKKGKEDCKKKVN